MLDFDHQPYVGKPEPIVASRRSRIPVSGQRVIRRPGFSVGVRASGALGFRVKSLGFRVLGFLHRV